LKYDGKSLGMPFNPKYSVLLKKDKDKDTGGSLKFGSLTFLCADTPKFDFKIDIKAKAKIEQTLKF
jgi:hypothetical protein